LHVAATPARADVILLSENFDDVSTLAGWEASNNSTPGGSTGWFQGNSGVFEAQSGPGDSYIAANYLNAGPGGNVSNWLFLPDMDLGAFDYLSFYTRSSGSPGFADRLEVRYSSTSSSNVGATDASVGAFTTLLLSVNPTQGSDYPTDWTLYTVSLSFLGDPTPAAGRLAFRYFVSDTNANGDYIGIDSVNLTRVPEPATLTLLGLGCAGLIARRRRQSAAAPVCGQQRGA
jgi:hypothetical protein